MAQQCPPGTRIVLGGYSQGAAVVDMLAGVPPLGNKVGNIGSAPPLPGGLSGNVAAVAVFGNPATKFGNPVSAAGSFAGKAIDLCADGDPICSDGRNPPSHTRTTNPRRSSRRPPGSRPVASDRSARVTSCMLNGGTAVACCGYDRRGDSQIDGRGRSRRTRAGRSGGDSGRRRTDSARRLCRPPCPPQVELIFARGRIESPPAPVRSATHSSEPCGTRPARTSTCTRWSIPPTPRSTSAPMT